MKKRSKRYRATLETLKHLIGTDGQVPLERAVEILKQVATAKFDETIELAIRLGVDPRKADQMVRGAVVLPHGTGKTVRVLVFARPPKDQEALQAGADYAGLQEYVEKIQSGWLEFDVAIAAPDVMGEVGKLGRILGPRGLMPNPKSGTVTFDVATAVREAKAGRVEYRVDKGGNVHVAVGRASFSTEKLAENIRAVIESVLRAKPPTAKGKYLRNVYLTSTMGPSIPISEQSLVRLRE
ncbi:MAG: 50S ribosomal protein L1 [Candidatus Kapabacteria bacterium]|nr:50S ribosomal protein L1 [Candidatus Kapabacteria bacterium]MCS7170230.1 50S ribosomal protein L1 [Candidatus Kapabacteria bacterium]MDW8225191.1 50S ribosomal protein L1 [Bacteroidota bacterium]